MVQAGLSAMILMLSKSIFKTILHRYINNALKNYTNYVI